MFSTEPARVGYVVKRYPRYSETFIVNEILAHEAAGLQIEVFSLRPPCDAYFQDAIARVRAPVSYLPAHGTGDISFWEALQTTSLVLPGLWAQLDAARGEDVGDVFQALQLACEARRRGIRHFHAHFATSATTVARLAARFAGLSFSFTAHAKDIYHDSVRLDDLRQKLMDAASVVTVSDFNVEYLRRTFGVATSHVQRIYNGLDLKMFPFRRPLVRPPTIVTVGRLVEKKGFADLIEACSILARQGCEISCRIIGTGPLESSLQAQIEALGLTAHVELVGPRPRNEVIRCVQGASVFAAPCVISSDGDRDGLPTVLVEAMALGTPCVSTDVTGIPEVLRDGETGLLVPQHDPRKLATAIQRLLGDRVLGVRLAQQARRLVRAEFDMHHTSARLRELFPAPERALGYHVREAS